MTDNQIIQSRDENGVIDPAYYRAACMDIIQRTFEEDGVNPEKVTTNDLQYALRQCYYAIFADTKKHDTRGFPKLCCNIPYTTENITALLLLYFDICEKYRALPSLYAFERFTGLTEETVKKYVTAAALETVKARKSAIQNKLYEATVGVITLANNDADSGLMYNRQNIVDNATIKKSLNFADLVQIAQKKDGGTGAGMIDDNGGDGANG